MLKIGSILLLSLISEMAIASCFEQRFTLSEILADYNNNHSIFTCKIQETYIGRGGYTSIAVVQQVLRGTPLDTVRIVTGGNTTAGGQKIQSGTNWLIISPTHDNLHFTATICHNLSLPISEEDVGCGNKKKIYGKDFLSVINKFYSLKRDEFSGTHKFYINDSIIAKGTFRKGIPDGDWSHYAYSRHLERQQLLFKTKYKNGIPDGTTVRYIRDSDPLLIESSITIKEGKLLQKQIYNDKFYDYTYPEEGVQSISYYRINDQGDTISISNSINHYSIKDQKFHAEYKHGPYYNTIDSSSYNPLCKGIYFRGARVGRWEFYNKNGEIIKQENYEFPKPPNNKFVIYQENGSLKISGEIRENKIVGILEFYYNDHLEYESYYNSKAQLQTNTRYYNKGGKKVTPYVKMKKHGTEYQYSKSGKLIEITNYNLDLKHGIHIKYSEEGDITYESYFNNGIETSFFRSDGKAPIINGFSNGYIVQFNPKTGAKIHEGQIWMGYVTGEYKNYREDGSYSISFYETDKNKLSKACYAIWPNKIQYFDKDNKIINEEIYDR